MRRVKAMWYVVRRQAQTTGYVRYFFFLLLRGGGNMRYEKGDPMRWARFIPWVLLVISAVSWIFFALHHPVWTNP